MTTTTERAKVNPNGLKLSPPPFSQSRQEPSRRNPRLPKVLITMADKLPTASPVQQLVMWSLNILATILLGMLAFMGRDLLVQVREMRAEFHVEQRAVWQALAERPVKSEVPPPEVELRFSTIEGILQRFESRLHALEIK